MENTFSTCRRAFRCKNQHEAFVTLNYVFQIVADIVFWIEEIQPAAFDQGINYEKTSPDSLIYSGHRKILYVSIHV